MVGERVGVSSLTVVFFLRELCLWFVVAPRALSGRADHTVEIVMKRIKGRVKCTR